MEMKTSKMALASPHISITLNENGLNSPIKMWREAGWIKKTRPIYLYAVYKTHFSFKDTPELKENRLKKILHISGNQKKSGIAIFIS